MTLPGWVNGGLKVGPKIANVLEHLLSIVLLFVEMFLTFSGGAMPNPLTTGVNTDARVEVVRVQNHIFFRFRVD